MHDFSLAVVSPAGGVPEDGVNVVVGDEGAFLDEDDDEDLDDLSDDEDEAA